MPQWNCFCLNCVSVRAGSPDFLPRAQSSLAVSADVSSWFLLNVSPDIRQQILNFPELNLPEGELNRRTSIAGCVLTDAELDHTLGLLQLREGCAIGIWSAPIVRRWLNQYFSLESVLGSFAERPWHDLSFDASCDLRLPSGEPSGLRVRAFELDPHVPKYVQSETGDAKGSVIGLIVEDAVTKKKMVYSPCVASLTPSLIEAARDADAIFLDGTFWSDDEMIRLGVGERTAREMGHLPVGGTDGSLNWLAKLSVRHRVYVHINNTNPMLNYSSAEYRQVRDCGVKIAQDGEGYEL